MFKEVLQITPKLTSGDLNNMERSLQSRFTKVAKGFGKGLLGVLGGAGVVGLVGGAIGSAISGIYDRLVAPLKETQSAIERTLKQADDTATNARAFGSSTGDLARLNAFGRATGLDPGQLAVLVQKFQASVAEANADPNKATAVRQFAGETNAVTGFFQFIQSLQKLGKNDQIVAQQEVFGEKQILKLADFLQSDFAKLSKELGGPSSADLTKSIDKLSALNDLTDLKTAQRELADNTKKAAVINTGVVEANDRQAKFDLEKENKRIASYDSIAAMALTAEKINQKIDDAIIKLADIAMKMGSLTAAAKGIQGAPVVRLPGRKAGEM